MIVELLDIVDENGMPTGEQTDRAKAHELGIRHRTSHVWILRFRDGKLQVLLQKRSSRKDSYPGCYDISSAGHIPAGVDFIPSALRELEEELGLKLKEEDLFCCGQRAFSFEREFHGKTFRDNQISNVYCVWLDLEEDDFLLQEEEVEEVRWFDFKECLKMVREQTVPNCIYEEELKLLYQGAMRS